MTITDAARGANQTFEYDELNRLKSATGYYFERGSREGVKEYYYDEVGNITRIVNDGVVKDYAYGETSGGPHAVTSITKDPADGTAVGGTGGAGGSPWLSFTYDENGNMDSQEKFGVGGSEFGDITEYTYDTENRLVQVTLNSELQAQYSYDGDGGRVKGNVDVLHNPK